MNNSAFKHTKELLSELEKQLRLAYPGRNIMLTASFSNSGLKTFSIHVNIAKDELPAYLSGLKVIESKVVYTFNHSGRLIRTDKKEEYIPPSAVSEPKPAEIQSLFLKLRKELQPDANYPSNTNYRANLRNAINYSNFKVKTERRTRRFRKQRKSTRRNARHRV
jgi:hypothetical protein